MIDRFARLLAPRAPSLAKASAADAGAIAVLHAASFRRGWSEGEFIQLLHEPNVLAHRALVAQTLAGFILSRRSGDEAEVLSVAVDARRRQRGVARLLLDLHLRSLAGLGVNAVFLEVDQQNRPAARLYARAGFYEVGRRQGYYYSDTPPEGGTALVLRRDLA